MGFTRPTRAEALARITDLVERYRPRAAELTAVGSPFTETEVRVSLIDPLLQALGWDVRNESGLVHGAEVVMERPGRFAEGGSWGRPDYRLRLRGVDAMPVEAKRPAVALGVDPAPSLQARSYGWSLSLPAAVLTNFHELIVFDATVAPSAADAAEVAVLPGGRFGFEEYVTRFDELWRLLSYESLSTAGLEQVYRFERPPRGESPFDLRFLAEFRGWRRLLAQSIAAENPALGAAEVGRRTQRLLNALLFLRVCEDRDIGRYRDLLESVNAHRLVQAFRDADRVFNAGLFTVLDDTAVSETALVAVIGEMYWPRTQFAFGVLEPAILAGLYEQYLAERVVISADRVVTLEQKPELAHAGGITTTPEFIVRAIGDDTVDPLLEGGIPADFRVLDLSCGSGIFLLDAYERLLARASADGAPTLAERGELARRHVFGVDLDGAAAEVAKLSILLAVLGDEHVDPATAEQVFPDLGTNIVVGNSVVREDFDEIAPQAARSWQTRARVSPLDLRRAFGDAYPARGFSAIVGNPPYVRIQVMAEHMPEQLDYLQDPRSGYESPRANNFDLYQVFVERALSLLSPQGRCGVIIPHRFTNLLAGAAIRRALVARIERLTHFRELQVFPARTTYVAIVVAGPKTQAPVALDLVDDLTAWRDHRAARHERIERADLVEIGAGTWPIATSEQSALFAQLRAGAVAELGDPDWVHIFVGVQTSADAVYFVRPTAGVPDDGIVEFVDGAGAPGRIERQLLRPAILDRSLAFFDGQPEPDRWAVFPYEPGEHPARPRAIPLEKMRTAYPHAHAYFERHRDRLVHRRKVSPDPGEAFWAYGRSQSLGKLAEPKLVVQVLSLTPKYALDEHGLVVPGGGDGGPYYLLRPREACPYPIGVVQAILSHPAVDLFVAVTGKRYSGSYASHRKAFLARVPMPGLDARQIAEIDAHAAELREIAVALRHETDSELLRTLRERRRYVSGSVEAALSAAYGLDPDLVARATGAA